MTSTELATVSHGNGLALDTGQDWWNDKQLAALRQIGVDRASNGDLAVFMHVCQRTGLDPFARQIYMIFRDGKQVIQTGIDGMRLVARRAVDRTGEVFGIGAPEWCDEAGVWHDVWLSEQPPAAARVTVRRGAGTFTAVALWREYVQHKRDGAVTMMWQTRSAGQLAKCAEALALRKSCPQDLSGIYSEDEVPRQSAEPRTGGLAAALADDGPRYETSGPDGAPDAATTAAGSEPTTSGPESAPPVGPEPLTKRTRGKLFALFTQKGVPEDEQLSGANHILGTAYESRSEFTEDDALRLIAVLEQKPDAEKGGE